MAEGVEGLMRDKTRKPGKKPLPAVARSISGGGTTCQIGQHALFALLCWRLPAST
jgi:hypothetical protein